MAVSRGRARPNTTAAARCGAPSGTRNGLRRRVPRLSYAEGARPDGPGEFHHVYLRLVHAAFKRTGKFRGHVLVLELHEAAQKVAPSRHGLFEGAASRWKPREGLGAFPKAGRTTASGDGTTATATAFPRGSCFECHRQHAARDNVFVQFYPVLRDGGH